MDLTKDALWIFGDSFTAESDEPKRFASRLREYFQTAYQKGELGVRYYNYSQGSMDTQTIIDNWLKVLPHMSENDAIIVCASDISRTRFPLKPEWVHTLPHKPNPYGAPEINSYYMYGPVGWDPVNSHLSTDMLDVPFPTALEHRTFTRHQNWILNTKSYDNSKIDLIEALYKLTPCKKKFVYTWADWDILQSEHIHSKKWIDENLFDGNWETLHEEWIRTNGESGVKNDGHLSTGCEQMMAEYFIKEFEL